MAKVNDSQKEEILHAISKTIQEDKRVCLIVDEKTGEITLCQDEMMRARDYLFCIPGKIPFEITIDFPTDSFEHLQEYMNDLMKVYYGEMERFREFCEKKKQEGRIGLFLVDFIENYDYETWCFEEQRHVFIYDYYFSGDDFEISDTIFADKYDRQKNDKYSVYTPSSDFLAVIRLDLYLGY